jgi:type II secretory pathway pseudopilin PulG
VRNETGSTLVELAVSLVLLGFFSGTVFLFFLSGSKAALRASAETRVLQQSRFVLTRMEREISGAVKAMKDYDPVYRDSAAQVNIFTDLNGDGKPELVRYTRQSNGNLQRGEAAPVGSAYPYSYGEPAGWVTVAKKVYNTDLFSITMPNATNDRELVFVKLLITNPLYPAATPWEIKETFAVRSRGEAK